MNRRDFIKNGALLAPAIAGGLVSFLPKNLLAEMAEPNAFSLSIVTDKPLRLIHEVEQLIKIYKKNGQIINFSEHRLVGFHVADLVLVENGTLVNYSSNGSSFSSELRKLANKFDLPKRVSEPWLITFSSGADKNPDYFNVMVKDRLVKRIKINSGNGFHKINGAKGEVTLEIDGKSARIHSSSCKHKTCMEMGEVYNSGESLVCIPNRVSVFVSGNSSGRADSITF